MKSPGQAAAAATDLAPARPLDRAAALWRDRRTAFWQVDLTDRTVELRLRARVVWIAALLGIAVIVAAVAERRATGLTNGRGQLAIAGILLLVFLAAAGRGSRLGDRQFLALLLVIVIYAAVAVYFGLGPGKVSQTTVSMLGPTIVASLFCGRRRHVAIHVAMEVALLMGTAATERFEVQIIFDLDTGVFSLVVVSAVVRLLRDLALSAVEQARRGEVTDPLTGLSNRRGFERDGGRRWIEHAREQLPVAMLVLDVDHFKEINDTLGHAAGDEILRRLADVIGRSVRADDVAVRLGGEEFLLLCSVPPGSAAQVAEHVRATVERELSPVTVSIGVHETVPAVDELQTVALWHAVDVADRAMYVAKQAGRNRVVSSTPAG